MKILHIIPSFGLGGMEKVICSIINHTFNQYQHSILSLDGDQRAFRWIKINTVDQIEFHKDRRFNQFLTNLYRKIRCILPDLLMTYNWGGTDAIWLGRLAGVKIIIHHEHGFSIEEAEKTILKRDIYRLIIYRMASVLITVSSRLGLSIQKKYCLHRDRVKIVPNGIDISYYSPDPYMRSTVRSKLNFGENDFVIVFSGRLDPVKNFELMLDVFEHCYKIDQTVRLLIVGDGPERQKIERISMHKKIHNGLVMVGQRSEVLPYLRAGDVFLLTSLTEQMPLTILEAMSVGLPVIASDVGEIRQIIDDGTEGFLRNSRDGCEGFATALLSLKRSCDRQTMSHAARAKIVAGFQETKMVGCYQRLIDNLLEHHRA
jgi:glycosyltransferase involved in cell wall biosynthesis